MNIILLILQLINIWQVQTYRINERAVEYAFVLEWCVRTSPQTILDIGTGDSPLPALLNFCGYVVDAQDNMSWEHKTNNKHWHVINDDIVHTKLTKQYDMITCISTLEHIDKADSAIIQIAGLLKKKGVLVMTFPYNEQYYYKDVYKLSDAGYTSGGQYICSQFNKWTLQKWIKLTGLTLIHQELWQVFTGENWTQGQRLIPPKRMTKNDSHQLTCVVFQK